MPGGDGGPDKVEVFPQKHQEAADHSYPLKHHTTTNHDNNNNNNNMEPEAADPTTTTSTTTTSTNMVVVGILVGLIVVLTIILVILLVRPVMDFVRARLPENKQRKELRYRTVEGWLISKRIRSHDEACSQAMTQYSPSSLASSSSSSACCCCDAAADATTRTTREFGCGGYEVPSSSNNGKEDEHENKKTMLSPAPSYDTAETAEQSMELEWKECPICMEEFKPNEIVSWSPDDQTSCLHFFHHECIKEWLLRSPHCPYCRCTIIPVDDTAMGNKVDKLTLLAMSKRRAKKASTTYCCHEHGLVTLRRPPRSRDDHTKNKHHTVLLDTVLQPNVVEAELVAKRGGRHEGSICNTDIFAEGGAAASLSSDSELSSILLPGTTTTTTIIHQEHLVPPSALLVQQIEATLAPTSTTTTITTARATVDADVEAPSPSGESVHTVTDEQASSNTTTTKTMTTPTTGA